MFSDNIKSLKIKVMILLLLLAILLSLILSWAYLKSIESFSKTDLKLVSKSICLYQKIASNDQNIAQNSYCKKNIFQKLKKEQHSIARRSVYRIVIINFLTMILAYFLTIRFVVKPIEYLSYEKEHFREISQIDYLTNILNRRAFYTQMEQYVKYSKLNGAILGILMIDIDNFKNINDTYGHEAGDEVLKSMSKLIKKSLRKDDLFGRLGGEEFCICILKSDKNSILKIAYKIKNEIEKSVVSYKKQNIKYTISIGCYNLQDKNEDYKIAIDKADHALYIAKNRGRNRVEIYFKYES